jgi:hypothetical protein
MMNLPTPGVLERQVSPLDKYGNRPYYSSVEHLAKTLLLSKWKGSVWGFVVNHPSAGYFDESCVDGSVEFPVVAGFWSTVELWIYCDEHLRKALIGKSEKVKAKKYVRANPVKFTKVVASFALVPVFATIEQSAFEPFYLSAKNQKANLFYDAYTVCSFAACEVLDGIASQKEWQKPVETVFDDGSPHKLQFERGYRKYYAKKADTYLSPVPNFKDDQTTLPLLAADLYAWLLVRKYNYILTIEEGEALDILQQYQPSYVELTDDKVRAILKDLRGGTLGNDVNAKGQTAQ